MTKHRSAFLLGRMTAYQRGAYIGREALPAFARAVDQSEKRLPLRPPIRKGACSICGQETSFACSDCKMDRHETIYVCESADCRDQHEAACSNPSL
jgi:hypothetical protein